MLLESITASQFLSSKLGVLWVGLFLRELVYKTYDQRDIESFSLVLLRSSVDL